jgi:NAD(P)-dependent dehydrogenase (short-subunit alcohol dehydrogenase family)
MMNNPLNFDGKAALITAAASGMGLATTRAFAERQSFWWIAKKAR